MGISIVKSGILSTFQDLGRVGYARFGINPGGAMDTAALRIGNLLCGNSPQTAALEVHFPAPEIEFGEPAVFALSGADFGPVINGRPIENWRSYNAAGGDVLRFTERRFGARAYLAVRGGFELDEWLGSTSTNLKAGLGGLGGAVLMKGAAARFRRAVRGHAPQLAASARLIPFYSQFPTLRVVAGPEFELLSADSKRLFFESAFEISRRSDRMGFRLSGENLRLGQPLELVSAAANFGTIQLLPDGQMIVLMADHQTSGGYPRIASIIPTDLPLAAQVQVGGKLAFHPVSIKEAERLFLKFETDLKILGVACRFRLNALD